MKQPLLILASKSPRRKKLLTEAGIAYQTIPSRVKEVSSFRRPALIVRELAYKKAVSVAQEHPSRPVLGSDTLVFCKGQVLGKPKHKKDALRLLSLQNGSWQTVHTGVSLIWIEKGVFLAGGESTRCRARALTRQELAEMSKKHLDKAGAYAVQDTDDIFISKMEGRFDTVVGLSMNLVRKFLKKAGLKTGGGRRCAR
jgi:septum formation protein